MGVGGISFNVVIGEGGGRGARDGRELFTYSGDNFFPVVDIAIIIQYIG